MAYGVDAFPNPPEAPAGHYEYDSDDDGDMIRIFVLDYDEDGNRLDGGER